MDDNLPDIEPAADTGSSRPTTAASGSRPNTAVSDSRSTTAASVSRPTTAASVSRPTTAASAGNPNTVLSDSRPGTAVHSDSSFGSGTVERFVFAGEEPDPKHGQLALDPDAANALKVAFTEGANQVNGDLAAILKAPSSAQILANSAVAASIGVDPGQTSGGHCVTQAPGPDQEPEPEPEPSEQFTAPRTEYYPLKRVRWDAVSFSTRLQLYRDHGDAGHEGAEVAQGLPPINSAPRRTNSNPVGMEPSLKRHSPWEMHASVRRMADAVLDQASPASGFDEGAEAEFAQQFIKAEIAKLNREAWEREQRQKEAAKYAPAYYKRLLDQSITRTVIPPPPSGDRDMTKPLKLAIAGLDFGSEAYRRQLSARIAQARGDLVQHVQSARGTGLSKTLNGRTIRQQPTQKELHRSDRTAQEQSLPATPPSAPLARRKGRRPRMIVRTVDQAERSVLSAR